MTCGSRASHRFSLSLLCTVQALEDLYYSTNGELWYKNTTWFKGDPCTRGWFGVFCVFTNDMYYVQSLYVCLCLFVFVWAYAIEPAR